MRIEVYIYKAKDGQLITKSVDTETRIESYEVHRDLETLKTAMADGMAARIDDALKP